MIQDKLELCDLPLIVRLPLLLNHCCSFLHELRTPNEIAPLVSRASMLHRKQLLERLCSLLVVFKHSSRFRSSLCSVMAM